MTPGERVAAVMKAQGGYLAVRVLPDDSVAALVPLIYTTGLVLGCSAHGYTRRFCYERCIQAMLALAELQSEDDEPVGWIANRDPRRPSVEAER